MMDDLNLGGQSTIIRFSCVPCPAGIERAERNGMRHKHTESLITLSSLLR